MSCNKNFLSLSLLAISTIAFSMDQQFRRSIPLKPLHVPNLSQSSTSSTLPTSSSAAADSDLQGLLNANTNETFDQEDIAEMNLVFDSSPKLAQMIVEHLKDPTYLNDREYRSAIFAGEPGTGKSMMAQAIACKMMIEAGWQYKFLSSIQFMEKFRNQTAIRLMQVLQAIKAHGKPMILIIDELNRLLEHAESQHHDTDATSAALWTFIDQMHKNEKFFFIGTMNRLTKLPKPYKSRILFEYILFPVFKDSAQKIAIIRNRLTDIITQIDPAVTDATLENELQQLGDCSQRDLKKLASFARRLYREKEKTQTPSTKTLYILIDQACIHSAVMAGIERKKDTKYDEEEKTPEERQESQHAENIELSNEHFVAQQKMQKDLHAENLAQQRAQFVQQQLIQMTISENQESVYGVSGGIAGGLPSVQAQPVRQVLSAAGHNASIDILTDEQKQDFNKQRGANPTDTTFFEKREPDVKSNIDPTLFNVASASCSTARNVTSSTLLLLCRYQYCLVRKSLSYLLPRMPRLPGMTSDPRQGSVASAALGSDKRGVFYASGVKHTTSDNA